MKNAPSPQEVRRIVQRVFAEYGLASDELENLTEMILVKEGRYRGRSYRGGELLAMWMVDVAIVQFYAADGAMLRTVSLLEDPVESVRARAA